jgi:threonine aldolase
MIDLRSDTITLPTDEMRDAMLAAPLGDDSREGDPTVRRLEKLAAEKLGKQDAIFVASGTMSNLVSLLAHTGRGGEVLLDGDCHFMRSEMGGISSLAGLFFRPIKSTRGAPDLEEIAEHINPKLSANKLATALVCIETTHNSAGGAALPLDYMAKLRKLTADKGVPLHIDGARVFNAAVAQGVPVSEIARHGDSVGFCVSKGLSAPFGSVLCGSAEFIEKARAYRLADDHRRARRLADGLHAIDPKLSNPNTVESNIVMVEIGHLGTDVKSFMATLSKAGVDSAPWSRKSIRLVTHRHIDDAAVDEAISVFRSVLGRTEVRKPAA